MFVGVGVATRGVVRCGAMRRDAARCGKETSREACRGGWFWCRRRGSVWVTGEVSGGSVCVRVGGLRARVQVREMSKRRDAKSTNSSAVVVLASLRPPNLLDRIGGTRRERSRGTGGFVRGAA